MSVDLDRTEALIVKSIVADYTEQLANDILLGAQQEVINEINLRLEDMSLYELTLILEHIKNTY